MPRPKKHPSVRQRRNVASSAAVLRILEPGEIEIPELPTRFNHDGVEILWEPRTLEWWEAIWSSPMAPEFHKSDIEGLYCLAVLKQQFWKTGDPRVHGEIRLYEQQFGLNPMARRKLEWQIEDTVEKVETADDRRAAREARQSSRPSVETSGSDNPLSA